MKKYWINRCNNIPVPLENYEIEEIVDWIFELGDLFPEAVDIIINGPRIGNATSIFWHLLDKGEWAKKYPDATAKLITFILNCNAELNYREMEVGKIARDIVCDDENTKRLLEELLIKTGL